MPAFLIENGFMDSPDDVPNKINGYRGTAAQNI